MGGAKNDYIHVYNKNEGKKKLATIITAAKVAVRDSLGFLSRRDRDFEKSIFLKLT